MQDTVDLAEGETEDVEFRIGDDIFFGTATGAKRNDGFEGAFVDSNNRNFAQDIADEQTMFIDLDNDTRVEIDLTGTRVAMEAGLECAAS